MTEVESEMTPYLTCAKEDGKTLFNCALHREHFDFVLDDLLWYIVMKHCDIINVI